MTEVNLSTLKSGDIAHFASGGSAKIHEIRFVKTNGNYIISFGDKQYVTYSPEGFAKGHPEIFNIIRVEYAKPVREGKVYAVVHDGRAVHVTAYPNKETYYRPIAVIELGSYREGDGLGLLEGDAE